LNHLLTAEQERDVKIAFREQAVSYPPQELQEFWGNISPDGPLPIERLSEITRWIAECSATGEYVLVQGEPGATVYIVAFCIASGRIPIYSTTRREFSSVTLPDGSIQNQHVFRHVGFRRYQLPFDVESQ